MPFTSPGWSRERPSSAINAEPDQLELLPEAELCNRAIGLRTDAVVGVPGRVLELLVPLLPQRRERLLVAGGRELVGASRRLYQVHEIEEAARAPGPT